MGHAVCQHGTRRDLKIEKISIPHTISFLDMYSCQIFCKEIYYKDVNTMISRCAMIHKCVQVLVLMPSRRIWPSTRSASVFIPLGTNGSDLYRDVCVYTCAESLIKKTYSRASFSHYRKLLHSVELNIISARQQSLSGHISVSHKYQKDWPSVSSRRQIGYVARMLRIFVATSKRP